MLYNSGPKHLSHTSYFALFLDDGDEEALARIMGGGMKMSK
jgi:hypothetical protein